jgi:hypothetical protein
MKIALLTVAAVWLMTSCEHKDCCDLSPCSDQFEAFKLNPEAKAIYQLQQGDNFYFWLNTDAVHYDGTEDILDTKCNKYCYFCGECEPPACSRTLPYDKDKWTLLWKK